MGINRELDIVVYGATGFTGRLVAEHLNRHYGVNGDVKWAMSGRSLEKLESVRDEMNISADVPLIVADASNPDSLNSMAANTKVVLTTVGPYQLYGNELISACVAQGTDYLDLCGEPNWMQEMIGLHQGSAEKSGARILFSCGFDSIPFDLGTYFLQQEAQKKFDASAPRVKCRVRSLSIPLSGGTVATYRATMAAAGENPATAEMLGNPFALTPGFSGPDQPAGTEPEYDENANSWAAPFIMAMINTKNIHRTNFLLTHQYGTDFVYDEMLFTGPGEEGKAIADFIANDKSIEDDPIQPGEGPTKEERESGSYDLLFIGEFADGKTIQASVKGQGDAGYGSTSKVIAETAVCLAQNPSLGSGGIWTPTSLLHTALIDQLKQHAGLSFEVE